MVFRFSALPYLILGFALNFSVSAQALSTPDPRLTPGEVCSPQDPNFQGYDYPEHIARCTRNVGEQEKSQIAAEYGNIPRSQWSGYEFDHLIPLCAGGSDSLANLWPQPISEAKMKDVLEDEICSAMKAGTLTQADAVAKVHNWFLQNASRIGDTNVSPSAQTSQMPPNDFVPED